MEIKNSRAQKKAGGKAKSPPAVLEFKGSMLTLVALHLYETRTEIIAEHLEKKITQAPALFKNAPLVIDLQAVQNSEQTVDLPFLIQTLRKHGVKLIGIRNGSAEQRQAALKEGLNLLPEIKSDRASPSIVEEKAEKKLDNNHNSPRIAAPAVKIITQPVRSGQQVTALEGDLVILSMVSSGAEILASRHIHVYGALRGRALAGVNGDVKARIFCYHLNAELVAIAGNYRVNEEINADLLGKPAQIYLENSQLVIEPFGTST